MSAEPRGEKPKAIGPKEIVDAVRTHLVRPVWDLLARGSWCRKQRRQLRLRSASVVWVRGDAVPWAEWGGRHGYFDVEHMNGIAYLRAVGAPIV